MEILGVNQLGQVIDLNNPPCDGCEHKHGQVCREGPLQFVPSNPVFNSAGDVVEMSRAGWMFPPAAVRCGRFKPIERESDTRLP